MDEARNARELGEHSARLRSLETAVSEMRDDVKAIRSTLDQAKGGWRTLLMICGAAGAVGASLVWLMQHIKIGG